MVGNKRSLDGFVQGRDNRVSPSTTSRPAGTSEVPSPLSQQVVNTSSTDDVTLSLGGLSIDGPTSGLGEGALSPVTGRTRRHFMRPSKRAVIWAVVVMASLAAVVGGFMAWKLLSTTGKVFQGNPLTALFGTTQLKADAGGRTNILLLGTSEDDGNHGGAYLTDSIMILSLSATKKDAYVLSVPRDLWVKYNRSCVSGNQGKINVEYICNADTANHGAGNPSDETAGQAAARTMIGNIFGLDIQYSVRADYTVLEKTVDAVGGITVTIASPDPRGVLDRNFDWKCPNGKPQTCYNVKYPNGPAHLDGLHALYLARARGDDPQGRTYGFSNANFDREKYQQAIMVGLKEKAASAGMLENPVVITNLLDALGNNIYTNINADEVKSFISLAKNIDMSKVTHLTLNDTQKPLVKTGEMDGESIVLPASGLYNYSAIQHYIQSSIGGAATTEATATVDVLNASGLAGAAQKQADSLAAQGLIVGNVQSVTKRTESSAISLYDRTHGQKPVALKKLQQLLNVTAATDAAPSSSSSTADFVVVLNKTSNQ